MKNVITTFGLAASLALAGMLVGPAYAVKEAKEGAKEGKDCATSCAEKGEKTACAGEKSACAGEKGACSASKGADTAKGSEGGKEAAGYGLGQQVPNFALADTTGKVHNLTDFKGKVVVLSFYNQGCPYVVEVKDRLNDFAKTYSDKGVVTVAVDAGVNNTEESIAEYAKTVSFPILVDRTSEIARKFNAKRTPEVFILNRDGVVAYHGAFDNGEYGSEPGARRPYAADAVDALLKGEEPLVKQTKAFGCTIKFAKEAAAAK